MDKLKDEGHSRNALPPGTVLNGVYRVEAEVGQGGFGIVYRARHTELGHPVAIKEYLPVELAIREGLSVHPRSADYREPYQEGMRRFLGEAKQLIAFRNHPNVVSCRDFFRAHGTAYLVMEYEEGLPLAELLQAREEEGRPFGEADLRKVMVPLLEGLARVHAAGVLHRDIKPGNILVRREDERPVLIDFGAAKQNFAEHTKSFAPLTEGYAAFEQVGEGKLGPWTDLYAVGAVMWRMVAGGNRPFEPPNPVKVESRTHAVLREEADPLPSARELGRGRFSERVLGAIDQCLELRESDRVQGCEELLGLLRAKTETVPKTLEPPPLERKPLDLKGARGEGRRKQKFTAADGSVGEGPYVDGKKHGDWVRRMGDGTVYDISYVAGEQVSLVRRGVAPAASEPRPTEEAQSQPPGEAEAKSSSSAMGDGKWASVTRSITLMVTRFITGILVAILYLVGKGMREQADQAMGMIFHIIAMLILFVVFFHWHRTMISPPRDFKKHRIRLACCWFLVGGGSLFGVFGLLALGTYGGELTQTRTFQSIISSRLGGLFGIEIVLMAVAALVSATGLLYRAEWAKIVAAILSFLTSMAFPFGLIVALYTWWAVRSKQLNADVIGGEDVRVNERSSRPSRNLKWTAAALVMLAVAAILGLMFSDQTTREASFSVSTQPPTARVALLNHQESYRPGMLLKPGAYHVEVSASGYETRRAWLEHDGSGSSHHIVLGIDERVVERAVRRTELERLASPFMVEPEPKEARVRILNIADRYRPGMKLPAGKYRVEISAPGYETAVEVVNHRNAPTRWRIELMRIAEPDPVVATASFSLLPEPASARIVLLNREEKYRRGMDLTLGSYHVEVSAPGYKTRRVWIEHSGTGPHRIALERVAESFTVEPEPTSAKVVLLNSRESYRPGMALPPGKYLVGVSAPGYEKTAEWIEHGNEPTRRRIRLEAKGNLTLHSATARGDVESVRSLLGNGANPNAKNADKRTPLHIAAQHGHVEIARVLLDNGAKPHAKKRAFLYVGHTPLLIAVEHNHVEVLRLLLERGADPEVKSVTRRIGGAHYAPLDIAAQHGHAEAAYLLLKNGVRLGWRNTTSVSAKQLLHLAAWKGHLELARLLLERGTNPNAKLRGRRPLGIAAQHGHTQIVQLLLEKGATR